MLVPFPRTSLLKVATHDNGTSDGCAVVGGSYPATCSPSREATLMVIPLTVSVAPEPVSICIRAPVSCLRSDWFVGGNDADRRNPARRRPVQKGKGNVSVMLLDKEPVNIEARRPETLPGCTASPEPTVRATVPVRLLTEKGEMGMRNATITDRQVDVLLDLEATLKAAFADGMVCTAEMAQISVLVARAKVKAERIHRSHVMAKNVLDNGEVNDNVLRMDREMKRDLSPVHLGEYRERRMEDSTA